jgi:hypothetical protein
MMNWVMLAEICCVGCVYLACGVWGYVMLEDWMR